MNRFLFAFVTLSLLSCKDKRLDRYEQLVNRVNRIVVVGRNRPDSVVISAVSILENTKRILKRNIEPESPRKFMVDNSIILYKAQKKIGVLMVSYGAKPYANFRSDSLNFTFQLTYDIGMLLDNLLPKRDH